MFVGKDYHFDGFKCADLAVLKAARNDTWGIKLSQDFDRL